MNYQPDPPTDPADALIAALPESEPRFDAVTEAFLLQSHAELQKRRTADSLLDVASLGRHVPWLYRLTFRTRGFVRPAAGGEIRTVKRHVIALRFLPDFLRRADRFEMLRVLEPHQPPPFHPNIDPATGAICVEVYAGEPLTEIVESLHDLIRWRLRQYDQRDALNALACRWGREHVDQPIDDRPLFGRRFDIRLEPIEP